MNDARRQHEIMVRLNDTDLARLDEHRGALSRAGYVRSLLWEPPAREAIADRQEILGLLTAQARAGKVSAAIALLRALRPEDEPTIEEELERLLGD